MIKSILNMNTNVTHRRLYIMRHAERVDFTFGDWIPRAFDKDGKYVRTDLNMPVSVPERKGGPTDYFKDCPLTRIGCFQARLTGEALKEKGIKFSHVFCSPSFRCIQTCTNVLQANNQSELSIHIEPGLFEWLNWYSDGMPVWFTNDEFSTLGYNIVPNYKPIVLQETLTHTTETLEDYYMRSYFLSKELLGKYKEGNLLFVGHAATLDTCSRQLLKQPPREINHFMHRLHRTPYASILAMEQLDEDQWTLIPPPICSGSVMHSNNMAYNYEILKS